MSWKQNKKNGRVIEDGNGNKILTAASVGIDPPQAWKNARLACGAPDLLSACESQRKLLNEIYSKCVNGVRVDSDWLLKSIVDATETAGDAIRRARGQE